MSQRVLQIDAKFTKNDGHAVAANQGMELMGFEIG